MKKTSMILAVLLAISSPAFAATQWQTFNMQLTRPATSTGCAVAYVPEGHTCVEDKFGRPRVVALYTGPGLDKFFERLKNGADFNFESAGVATEFCSSAFDTNCMNTQIQRDFQGIPLPQVPDMTSLMTN